MASLAIPARTATGLDFMALGALVHRLDPGAIPFRKARSVDIWVSGGEYNVAANLSDCFGLATGISSAMVKYPVGDLIAGGVRAMGVRGFYKQFEHDGVTGPNMATVYSDRGQGVRAPVVFYNRCNEAASLLKPGDFDWKGVFANGGCRWLHSGGIFASLGEGTANLIIEGFKAAKAAGAVTSFDLNFRAKLWNRLGGTAKAQAVLREIVRHTDVLVGNEEDLQLGLGLKGPDAEAKNKLDPSVFFGMMDAVAKDFPNISVVATTLREVHSTNRHSWGAVLWKEGKTYVSPTCEIDVVCRIGGGDGFAAGCMYGLLAGKSPEESLRLGWAHGAMLTTTPGDTTMVTLDAVEQFAKGGSARVQR